MTQRFVEGFATYGQGTVTSANAIGVAMLAGRWASLTNGALSIGQLPWAPTDTDLYFKVAPGGNGNPGQRFVLPVSAAAYIISAYFAVGQLPTHNPYNICSFCDGSNAIIAAIEVLTTGAIALQGPTGTIIGQTSGPVLTAQSAAHIEFELSCGSPSTFTLQVNGTTVLAYSGSGIAAATIAQINLSDGRFLGSPDAAPGYYANLIARDTAGTYNNSITGDRRVATLWPDADDPASQGWTAQPLKLYGNGILDNSSGAGSGNGVVAGATSSLDIGAQQFTIEGWFRFQALPTGSNSATLFSRWDLANNNASYMLYVGGPSLESGNTVFVISTDGAPDTRVELISWAVPWQPGEWYHVAVARDGSNNTRLFVNGILQGLAVADANTYYSAGLSGPAACLGGDSVGVNVINNTSLNGWQDEFRLTIGACRYTANFTPTGPFPRGGADPNWANVVWLSGWDLGTVVDESSFARSLTARGGTAAITPNDGQYNFQVLNKTAGPNDNTFIEAALTAATNILTYGAAPTNGKEVTVGTENGTTPAVYTWVSGTPSAAWQVHNPGTIAGAMTNLAAAINAGAGAGTLYGTGTTANADVTASVLISEQLEVQAITAGAAGNSIASTTNDPGATWEFGATLTGGVSLPSPSRFYVTRLPSNTTLVDSLCILSREWKTDAGTCQVRASLIGGVGGVENGASLSITTAPTFYADMFETDPDTGAAITPTTVLLARVQYDRTA